MFYDVNSALLYRNINMGPRRCLIPGVAMAEHARSSFFFENDNGSKICSPVNSLRGISKHYSMSLLLYYLFSHLVQA